MKILVRKPLGFRTLNHSSEMQSDSLVHREGSKGLTTATVYLINFINNLFVLSLV